MTKNTHLASGLAISVAFIRPTSFKSLAICLTSAAIGSLISDIDITTSKSRKDLDIIILVFCNCCCTMHFSRGYFSHWNFIIVGISNKYY